VDSCVKANEQVSYHNQKTASPERKSDRAHQYKFFNSLKILLKNPKRMSGGSAAPEDGYSSLCAWHANLLTNY
jgi:hypothetical protein